MLLKKDGKTIVAAALIIGTLVALGFYMAKKPMKEQDSFPSQEKQEIQPKEKIQTDTGKPEKKIVQGEIEDRPAIDFKNLKKDPALDELMVERKDNLGIKESLDMIVRSDEKFVVGGQKISMQEILEKAFTGRGEVYQEEIKASGEEVAQDIKEYGIYVVRPGDNLWNIHFNILREYYASRGIEVESKADEPKNMGFSSGVGKILKFSETMVIIYNLIDRKVSRDINLLRPLSKVVVYNMSEVFSLLREFNYENVDRIQFDGRNIWIPANKN
ncbi:hypothetical protein [Desulfospira joergensenii]|uniref:hypothetical protein n=1 Tax=Desulfospira joergensenii TaxID=53329 RepID=UPI000405F48B|nr:hypothetical protein [Desulfospira joergensenii]